MNTQSSVIFLDFDGVLNSVRSATALGDYPHNLEEESLKLFDTIAISLIRKLCTENSIQIVCSSCWRRQFTADQLSKALNLPIIDVTIRKMSATRGEEIQMYLDMHPNITAYVILDDDSDMLERQKARFVQTSNLEGFSYRDYIKVKELFGVK